MQETTTDAAKCSWENDAWVRALNTNTWSQVQNDALYAVYVRTLQGIAYVNEYMRQTSPQKLADRGVSDDLAAKIQVYRCEARFIRAYLYWMALDCFGSVPFTTEDSPFGGTYFPEQAPREDIYDFCISELQFLMSDQSPMPAPRSNYPRADKGSSAGLLARMYLNSSVYTGIDRWSEAKSVCERIFSMGYALSPDYPSLFRGDNGENSDVLGEMLWAVAYDSDKIESYGGTTYILAASLAATDITEQSRPNGQRNGWAGLRVPFEYVDRYYRVGDRDYVSGMYEVADSRGNVFYIKGRSESMDGALYSFMNGWSCLKFNNIPSGQTDQSFLPESELESYSDIDFPMIRLAEIYLIYAEACMHLGMESLALPLLAELSSRADVAPPSEVTPSYLEAERARELLWEAHRRTDLIRFGLYTSSDYLWPYKGGDSFAGQPFPDYKTIFPIPPTELSANDRLVQNPGY